MNVDGPLVSSNEVMDLISHMMKVQGSWTRLRCWLCHLEQLRGASGILMLLQDGDMHSTDD